MGDRLRLVHAFVDGPVARDRRALMSVLDPEIGYSDATGGRIRRKSLMCSGFRSWEEQPADRGAFPDRPATGCGRSVDRSFEAGLVPVRRPRARGVRG
jgi:hypothetical protein